FGDLVVAECARRPLLLVIEDMHWGDNASVQLIDATLRRCEESPLFVLVLARLEVHDLFPKLFAGADVQEIRLKELSPKASLSLAREVLGQEAESPHVQQIVARAGGNAFYLEEILRAIAEGTFTALPETVLGMVEARLLSLEPEARRVLRA